MTESTAAPSRWVLRPSPTPSPHGEGLCCVESEYGRGESHADLSCSDFARWSERRHRYMGSSASSAVNPRPPRNLRSKTLITPTPRLNSAVTSGIETIAATNRDPPTSFSKRDDCGSSRSNARAINAVTTIKMARKLKMYNYEFQLIPHLERVSTLSSNTSGRE